MQSFTQTCLFPWLKKYSAYWILLPDNSLILPCLAAKSFSSALAVSLLKRHGTVLFLGPTMLSAKWSEMSCHVFRCHWIMIHWKKHNKNQTWETCPVQQKLSCTLHNKPNTSTTHKIRANMFSVQFNIWKNTFHLNHSKVLTLLPVQYR